MKRNTRVLLASEHPETRSFLRRIVESEDRVVVIAEAETSAMALNLALNLRPDIALIDGYMPYVPGYDGAPMPRTGALNLARSIVYEVPDARVVLLNRVQDDVAAGGSWRPDLNGHLCRESGEACVPISLAELGEETRWQGALVFANLETEPATTGAPKQGACDGLVFFGTFVIAGGLVLIVSVALSVVGVFVVALGALMVLAGLGGKMVSRAVRRMRRSVTR